MDLSLVLLQLNETNLVLTFCAPAKGAFVVSVERSPGARSGFFSVEDWKIWGLGRVQNFLIRLFAVVLGTESLLLIEPGGQSTTLICQQEVEGRCCLSNT